MDVLILCKEFVINSDQKLFSLLIKTMQTAMIFIQRQENGPLCEFFVIFLYFYITE